MDIIESWPLFHHSGYLTKVGYMRRVHPYNMMNSKVDKCSEFCKQFLESRGIHTFGIEAIQAKLCFLAPANIMNSKV
jgi:hypothetical protein